MPSWCLLTPASTCLTPRTVRSRPRPVRKVWSGLEELLSGLGLEIPRHRGGPWLCRWTSTSTPVELSSLELCQHPSCSHKVRNFAIQPRLQLGLLCSAKEFPVLIHHLPHVNFNSLLISTRHGEDLQHIRRTFIEVERLISQDINDQATGVWDRDIFWFRKDAGFGHHAWFSHNIWLRRHASRSISFSALLEPEPQHFDDPVGALVRIVLPASGLVAEAPVVTVSVVVLWPVVAVAVLWHVVVAVVPSIRSVLLSLLWVAVVQSGLVVLVMVHVLFSSPSLLCQVSPPLLAFPSQQVMPSDVKPADCCYQHLRLLRFPSSGFATDGLLHLISSSILHLQERSHLSLVWIFQLSSF